MYFIRKSTRNATEPYRGITCQKAGIPIGKWYANKDEAEQDAKKLSAINPVGFVVEFKEMGEP